MSTNGSGRGITINGSALTKVLASLNGLLLAVALYFLSTFGGVQGENTRRLNAAERSIAVIEGNRFTSADALALEHHMDADLTSTLDALKSEMNARFDRLEARIDRIGGGER